MARRTKAATVPDQLSDLRGDRGPGPLWNMTPGAKRP